MKKIIPVLLLMCLLCGLAACGSNAEDTIPAPAAPAATEEPAAAPETVEEAETPAEEAEAPAEQEAPESTPEPAEPEENDQLSRPDSGKAEPEQTDSGNDSGNNSDNDSGDDSGDSADPYELAQQYLGSDAGTFQSVVGSPSGTEYTISCEADGAEDGVWYYDGFVVWTVRYADGTEIIRDCDAY